MVITFLRSSLQLNHEFSAILLDAPKDSRGPFRMLSTHCFCYLSLPLPTSTIPCDYGDLELCLYYFSSLLFTVDRK